MSWPRHRRGVRVPRSQAIHDVWDTPAVREAVAIMMAAVRRVRRSRTANAVAGVSSANSVAGCLFTVVPSEGLEE